MKNDTSNTCCNESESLTKSETHPLNTEQPDWKADRHDNGIDVEVTLPGVAKEDLKLEVHGSDLRLTAQRKSASEGKLIIGREAPTAYALKLKLGESLDGDKLQASLRDGLLKISIPLAEQARAKTISID